MVASPNRNWLTNFEALDLRCLDVYVWIGEKSWAFWNLLGQNAKQQKSQAILRNGYDLYSIQVGCWRNCLLVFDVWQVNPYEVPAIFAITQVHSSRAARDASLFWGSLYSPPVPMLQLESPCHQFWMSRVNAFHTPCFSKSKRDSVICFF